MKYLITFFMLIFLGTGLRAQPGKIVFNDQLGGNFSKFKIDRQGTYIYDEQTMYRAKDFAQLHTFPISISYISPDGNLVGGHIGEDSVALYSSVSGAKIAALRFRKEYNDRLVAMDEESVFVFNFYKGAKKIQWANGAETLFENSKSNFEKVFETTKKGIYTIIEEEGLRSSGVKWSVWDLDQMQQIQTPAIVEDENKYFATYNAHAHVVVLYRYITRNITQYGFYDAATGRLIKEIELERSAGIFPSYDNTYIIFEGEDEIETVVDASTGHIVKNMPNNRLMYNDGFSGKNMTIYGTEFRSLPEKDRFVFFDLSTAKKIREIDSEFERLLDVRFGLNGDYMLLNDNGCFDMSHLKQVDRRHFVPSGPGASNSSEVWQDRDSEELILINHATGEKTSIKMPLNQYVPGDGIMMSSDGKKIYALGTPANAYSLFVYDISTKTWKKLVDLGELYHYAFSYDRQFLSFISYNRQKKTASLTVQRIADQQKMCSIDVSELIDINNFNCTGTLPLNGGDKVVYTDKTDLYIFDVKSGSIVQQTKSGNASGANGITLSDDLSKIITTDNGWSIFIHNIEGQLESILPIKTYRQLFGKTFMLTQQNKAIVVRGYGEMYLFRVKDGKKIGTLYLYNKGQDYLFLSDNGRFDGTEYGMKQLSYLKNRDLISLDKVFERYFTPNLYLRMVNGEDFPPVDIDLHPLPSAKILYAEAHRNLEVEDDIASYVNSSGVAELRVNAVAPEDKVDEIRLFHNGKAVNLATRGLFVSDDDGTDSKKYTINLLPGVNTFRAVALNSQRTESEPDQIIVHYDKDGKVPTPTPAPDRNTMIVDAVDRNATLHIVVVGINAYKEKINPLTYALPDAAAFKAELEKDAKSVINHVNSFLIADADASKSGIIAAFDTIKKSAKPQDVFVFYYAGHGYIHPSNKEFYLVSADVTDGEESLLKNGVSAKELQTLAVDIPAQKQLFIMDACQSAGAFEKMLQHDGEQQKALAVVSRSTGTHWMAASGSTETAKEFGELGHGAFTYVLLQALKGSAASNKMITVNGLKSYLQIHVPELIKKYGSAGQYPASYGFGNDFPVEIVK